MFERHATVRHAQSRRMAPGPAPSSNIHSNDNRLDFRRPAGQLRRPKPALTCHWIEVGGRLGCRWKVVTGRDASHDNPGRAGSPPGLFEPPRRGDLAAQFSIAT